MLKTSCVQIITVRLPKKARKNVICVRHGQKLDEILNLFKKSRNHLFIVKDDAGNFLGLITIEDILGK